MENVACNYCGSTLANTRFTLHDYLLDRPAVCVTLVECMQCGLIYQNPRLGQAELEASYPQDYEPFNPPDPSKTSGFRHWIGTRGLQKRVQAVRQRFAGGRLLDIGCASGSFLQAMQAYPAWQLFGVEPNPGVAEAARKHAGLSIFTGTLEQAAYADNIFDAVTLWDVLEHLPDPASTLVEIRRILKPGGMLALRLPNFNSLEARIFGSCWVGLDAPRHLYVFSKRNLGELLTKYRFKVIKIGSGIGSFPNFILTLRFWMTARHIHPPLRKAFLSILEFLPVRAALSPFFYLIDQLGVGSSMVVISFKE